MEPRCSQGGRRGTPRKTETAPQVAPMPPHTLPATWRGCNWGAMGCNWGAIGVQSCLVHPDASLVAAKPRGSARHTARPHDD